MPVHRIPGYPGSRYEKRILNLTSSFCFNCRMFSITACWAMFPKGEQ